MLSSDFIHSGKQSSKLCVERNPSCAWGCSWKRSCQRCQADHSFFSIFAFHQKFISTLAHCKNSGAHKRTTERINDEQQSTLQAQRSTQAHNRAKSNRALCEHIPENEERESSRGRCAFVPRWPVMMIMIILHCSDYQVWWWWIIIDDYWEHYSRMI